MSAVAEDSVEITVATPDGKRFVEFKSQPAQMPLPLLPARTKQLTKLVTKQPTAPIEPKTVAVAAEPEPEKREQPRMADEDAVQHHAADVVAVNERDPEVAVEAASPDNAPAQPEPQPPTEQQQPQQQQQHQEKPEEAEEEEAEQPEDLCSLLNRLPFSHAKPLTIDEQTPMPLCGVCREGFVYHRFDANVFRWRTPAEEWLETLQRIEATLKRVLTETETERNRESEWREELTALYTQRYACLPYFDESYVGIAQAPNSNRRVYVSVRRPPFKLSRKLAQPEIQAEIQALTPAFWVDFLIRAVHEPTDSNNSNQTNTNTSSSNDKAASNKWKLTCDEQTQTLRHIPLAEKPEHEQSFAVHGPDSFRIRLRGPQLIVGLFHYEPLPNGHYTPVCAALCV